MSVYICVYLCVYQGLWCLGGDHLHVAVVETMCTVPRWPTSLPSTYIIPRIMLLFLSKLCARFLGDPPRSLLHILSLFWRLLFAFCWCHIVVIASMCTKLILPYHSISLVSLHSLTPSLPHAVYHITPSLPPTSLTRRSWLLHLITPSLYLSHHSHHTPFPTPSLPPLSSGDRGFSIGVEDVTPNPRMVHLKTTLISEGQRLAQEQIQAYKSGRIRLKPGCDALQSLESEVNGLLGKNVLRMGCSRMTHL